MWPQQSFFEVDPLLGPCLQVTIIRDSASRQSSTVNYSWCAGTRHLDRQRLIRRYSFGSGIAGRDRLEGNITIVHGE
jgi:hypothetical protein